LQIKTKIVSYHTADSKPVKQEVNGQWYSDTSPFSIPWLTQTKIQALNFTKNFTRVKKVVKVTNTLAYCTVVLINVVKSFEVVSKMMK
jgi:hypothetical protein